MPSETLVHQVNAALRCVDANSGRTITSAQIRAAQINADHVRFDDVQFIDNHNGEHVLVDRGALTQIAIVANDRAGFYLPRSYTLTLPRDPDPANASTEGSLFQAARVMMYPAPASAVASGWAIVRVTVVNAADDAPLPGALVRLVQIDGDRLLARGISEWRGRAAGEALITAPGVPAITFGPANNGDDGAVLVRQIAARVEAYFDPQSPASDAQPPNPDDLDQRRAQLPTASSEVMISAGKAISVKIAITLP